MARKARVASSPLLDASLLLFAASNIKEGAEVEIVRDYQPNEQGVGTVNCSYNRVGYEGAVTKTDFKTGLVTIDHDMTVPWFILRFESSRGIKLPVELGEYDDVFVSKEDDCLRVGCEEICLSDVETFITEFRKVIPAPKPVRKAAVKKVAARRGRPRKNAL